MDDPASVKSKMQELSDRLLSIEESFVLTEQKHVGSQSLKKKQLQQSAKSSVFKNFKDLSDDVKKVTVRLSQLENNFLLTNKRSPDTYLGNIITQLSMPGLKFTRRNGHTFHAYLWIFIHIIALFLSYIYIAEEYRNWQSAPVIRTLSNNLTSIEEIPFPAVTICFPNALKSDFDYVERLKTCLSCNNTEASQLCSFNTMCSTEDEVTLAVASLICDNTVNNGIVKEPPWLVYSRDKSETIESLRFSKLLEKVFPACDVNITQFKHINDETITGCDENRFQHFVVANSKYAMCTTINGLRHEDIYKKSTVLPIPIKPKPHDNKYKGKKFTLEKMFAFGAYNTVPLYGDFDDLVTYYVTKRKNQKNLNICNYLDPKNIAYVILHNPAVIPLMLDYFYGHVIQEDEFNTINITPKLVNTANDLRSYNPKERGCFYSYERQLALFKSYNQNNCEIECYVNCTLQKCGCVPSHFPTHNTSIKVCLSKCPDYDCDCGCLPDCVSLTYKFEANTVEANLSGKAHIQIGFKTKSFYSTIRVSINSFAQFMAFSLGILGVCNGFSVMVVLELLYLMTFNIWHSVKMNVSQITNNQS